MSLPPDSADRQLRHQRSLDVQVFARGDGLWEVDARLTDVKTRDMHTAGGVRPAGVPLHDMLLRLGYFVTESSEHFSEYVPWFIKRDQPELIGRFRIPLDEYIKRCEDQIAGWHALRASLENGNGLDVRRSREYGSLIIHSMETGTPRVVYGNVENKGLIDNLPQGYRELLFFKRLHAILRPDG